MKPSDKIRQILQQHGSPETPDVVLSVLTQYLDEQHEKAKPKPIICQECVAQGKPSKIVSSFRNFATMDVYHEPVFHFDEDGREHFHDENRQRHRVGYRCANGHEFNFMETTTPCWCGWPDKDAT